MTEQSKRRQSDSSKIEPLSSASAEIGSGRFTTLDGMRGAAALLVVAYHLEERPGGLEFPGYLAVDLFFVLSGFVIALNYTNRLGSGLSTSRFFEVRLIRLFPLHVMGTLLGAAKQLAGALLHDPRAMQISTLSVVFAFNVAMVPVTGRPELFPLNGPSWSLFFEIIINVCFAASLSRASTSLIVGIMIIAFAGLKYGATSPFHLNGGWGWENFHVGIFRTTYSFLAGVLIYRCFPAGARRKTWFSLAPIAMMIAAMAWRAPVELRSASELLTVGIGFPILVLAGTRFDAPPKIARTFSILGDLSYPIYAIHWPLIAIVYAITAKFHLSPRMSAVSFILLLFPAAYATAKIDGVVRKRISIWAHVRRTAAPQMI